MKLHCKLSVCHFRVSEDVSFGAQQGWLIPEHGWVKKREERGGSGVREVGQGRGSTFQRPSDLTLNLRV